MTKVTLLERIPTVTYGFQEITVEAETVAEAKALMAEAKQSPKQPSTRK